MSSNAYPRLRGDGPAAQLSGTGRLADDLHLIAHHEVTGKPHLQPRAVGLALAGGLLAELALADALRVRRGLVIPAAGRPPGDGLARGVLALVSTERQHLSVRDWLLFLARTSAADVAVRLEASGYLTRAPTRRLRRAARWVPVDAECAYTALVRVQSTLRPGGRLTAEATAVAGLAAACGLGPRLFFSLPPNARHRLDTATRHLDPGVRELIAQTQTAVDSALLAHRV
jgi:Golgi phosphoprotein 3 (GPP34)